LRRLIGAAVAVAALACDDQSYREIRTAIDIVARRDEAVAAASRGQLIGFGRRALPQIETALHTAPEKGRLALVGVLEQIADEEASPILRHFAVYDASADVREACEAVLWSWAKAPGLRGERAREAVARVIEQRGRGEGPLPPR
jgi:hypothetical protein